MHIKKIPVIKLTLSGLITIVLELGALTPVKRLIQYRKTGVIKVADKIGDTSVIEYFLDSPCDKSLVILQHGYLSKKEHQRDFATKLANAGYFVVTTDAYGHGDRNEPDRLTMIDIIIKTTMEYDGLIEHYINNTDVNALSFVIIGQSMGGMIAYHYLVTGKYKPRAIATMISTPDMRELINYELGLSYCENHHVHRLTDQAEIQKYNLLYEKYTPYEKLKAIDDVPMIIQNMRFDFLIGSAGSDNLYNELKHRRSEKSFKYSKLNAFFHYVPDRAKNNIIEFLKNQH